MTVQEYFALPDTPMADSPTGRTMIRLLDKRPELSFEQTRATAAGLLQDAAGRKHYCLPRVFSVAEEKTNLARVRAAFGNRSTTPDGDVSRCSVATQTEQTEIDYSG